MTLYPSPFRGYRTDPNLLERTTLGSGWVSILGLRVAIHNVFAWSFQYLDDPPVYTAL
jgi:hypothetical protein